MGYRYPVSVYALKRNVMDRHRFDAEPDPDPDPNRSCWKVIFFFTFIHSSASVHCFIFLFSPVGVTVFNILFSVLKFSEKSSMIYI
jgi:hypothetical protein